MSVTAVPPELLADLGRVSRERDHFADLAERQRRRYIAGLDAALALIRERPEADADQHAAA